MGLLAGGLIITYGLRRMLLASAILLVIGLALIMTQKWQLWLGLGVLLGLAPGLTALVLSSTVATRWFTQRRGLVLGIHSAGSATGQLILLTPTAWIAENYGWRISLLPGAIMIGVLAVLFFALGRDRPQELGLRPYGETGPPASPAVHKGNPFQLSRQSLRLASGSLVFWALSFTFFICGVTSFGLVPHFVTLCGDFGVGPIQSTAMLTMIGVFDLIGTIGSGWLSDRYDNRMLLFWYYLLRGLSLFWLPMSDFTLMSLGLFAMVYGLDFIAALPPTARLTIRTFGTEMGPLVIGWLFASHQLGAGITAFLAGLTHDLWLTYVPAVMVAGATGVIAALSLLLLYRQQVGPLPAPA
jgi:sugar phosphate permease